MALQGSWATQQLAEFVAAVSMVGTHEDLVRDAVEHATEALEGEVGAFIDDSGVRTSFGFPAGRVPVDALLGLTGAPEESLEVQGAGRCALLLAPFGESGRLVVGRSGDGFTREEQSLLRAMARVLDLRLEAVTMLQHE